MDRLPPCYGIIPARYQSSRFPGKPLAPILGKPMFWHVFDRARQCSALEQVLLATDDQRIREAAEQLSVPVVMTRSDHPSGTDRVLEAAESLDLPQNAVVINIQGDEPALDPGMLYLVLKPFSEPETQVATLAHRITKKASLDPDRVNTVISKNGNGLYFSRSQIPFSSRDDQRTPVPYFEHVGLYAFRFGALKRFVSLGPSPLEEAEQLEMLRLLENDIPIRVEISPFPSVCVERPEDLERAEEILLQQGG